MKSTLTLLCLGIFLVSCKSKQAVVTDVVTNKVEDTDFTIAFGSCNKATIENKLWDDVLAQNPNVWIWGGDIIYADTDNMNKLRQMYAAQDEVPGYINVKNAMPVIGTWDDHDYGVNDGGVEFKAKKESQKEFLDFMGIPEDSPRRQREGVYASHDYTMPDGKVRVIVLDTRYFRTALTKNPENKRRNVAGVYGEGTVLGEQQWLWLENELQTSDADFNVIVSSIQVLSVEHGFETWGNFPHEIDKLKKVVATTKAKGVLLLSGDRHISEFTREAVAEVPYPLIDFTSSGLTHVYSGFSGEPNANRVGEVIYTENFGVITFNFTNKTAHMKLIGKEGNTLAELEQTY